MIRKQGVVRGLIRGLGIAYASGPSYVLALAAVTTASVGGLLFSYYFDFSVGPAVAMFLGAVLVAAAVIAKFRSNAA